MVFMEVMDDNKFKLPLCFAVGSKITREHVALAYQEAGSFPQGSREYRSFLSYAQRLEKECSKQEELNKTPNEKQ